MPIGKYYKGHGQEVMANMTKEYGAKKGKQVFYATANKMKSHMPKGATQSPKGDLGMRRQAEARRVGGYKGIKDTCASYEFSGEDIGRKNAR